MIQDTESSADILCFKPDPVIGKVEKLYGEEGSLPPATCKVRILDRKLSTDMQKEMVDVPMGKSGDLVDSSDSSQRRRFGRPGPSHPSTVY